MMKDYVIIRRGSYSLPLLLLVMLVMVLSACGGRKRDIAYYELLVDSIRKAEQLKEIQKKSGDGGAHSAVEAWFDTLGIHTLPIRSAGAKFDRIGSFTDVPMSVNEYFGYPVSAKLKALALPKSHHHQVVLLTEMRDSLNSALYLYTMDKKHMPIDQLCLYERKSEEHKDDFGESYMEYFITSDYEITLILYFQSHKLERKPEVQNARRYVIDKEGLFEEIVIEL